MDDRPTGRPVPDDTDDDPPRVTTVGQGVPHAADGHVPVRPVADDDTPTNPRLEPVTGVPPGGGAPVGGAPVGGDPPDAVSPSDGEGDGEPPAAKSQSHRSLWRELPLLLLLALVLALLIKTFVVQAFFIPTSSMEPTLDVGDKILVNKLVYHFRSIQPGDIIVFDGAGSWNPVPAPSRSSSDPFVRAYDATLDRLLHSIAGMFGTVPGQTDYIKRVIGTPGDKVVCCNNQGLITVNGVPLQEQSYLFPGEVPSDAPAGYSGRFSITVPAGRLWVLGDNRAVSDDSRLRLNDPGHGTIPENMVIGRAFMIVWPPSRWRILGIPSTFLQRGIMASAAAAPALPLAAGFAFAVPLTWLQRRLRRRWHRDRCGSPGR